MKILVAIEPADFRRVIDGPAPLCREALQQDPFTVFIFVFRNRLGTGLKLLTYDRQGFCVPGHALIAFLPNECSLGVEALW